MMIKVITGREVPSGKLPMDAGCAVQNIGTLKAISEAVEKKYPSYRKSGYCCRENSKRSEEPMVKLGTPLKICLIIAAVLLHQTARLSWVDL
jgi:electron transport complex protein RnfC